MNYKILEKRQNVIYEIWGPCNFDHPSGGVIILYLLR